MGRSPCCSKEGLNKGAWTAQEDDVLKEYIRVHGEGGWRNLPKKAGMKKKKTFVATLLRFNCVNVGLVMREKCRATKMWEKLQT